MQGIHDTMSMKLKHLRLASVQGLMLAVVLALAGVAPAQEPVAASGTCRVVIVGGLPGTPVHARRFADWIGRFRSYCIARAGVPAAQVTLVSGDAALKRADCEAPVSASNVIQVLNRLADVSAPSDQFVLFMVGHGDMADGEATLSLPGRDLRAGELKSALAGIRAGTQIVIHAGAASGDMLAALAATNRVVVTGTSPGEQADPVFAEFFLQALEKASRPPTVLEAFNTASLETARWIRRISQTETAWCVQGKEAIRLFTKLSGGSAGMAGARTLDPGSKPVAPDPEIPLLSPAAGAAGQTAVPPSTRVITEHALVEDAGHEAGLAAVGPQGYVPVTGAKAGETGARAAQVVIGMVK